MVEFNQRNGAGRRQSSGVPGRRKELAIWIFYQSIIVWKVLDVGKYLFSSSSASFNYVRAESASII